MAVGFRLASYKRGSIAVVGVDGIPFVSEAMRAVVASFEAFVRNSGLFEILQSMLMNKSIQK